MFNNNDNVPATLGSISVVLRTLHDQASIMKIAFAAVFGFQVLCSVGFTAPSSTMGFTGEDITEDDVSTNDSTETNSYLSQTKANLDLTGNQINESEIFESGQAAKEDRQRSFIYIHNAKSRLPWKSKTRGSFFLDDFTNAKEVFNDGNGNLNPCKIGYQPNSNRFYNKDRTSTRVQMNKNCTQANMRNRDYYSSVNYPLSSIMKGRNRMGDKKRPSVSSNVRTLPPPTPVTIKSYYRTGFKLPIKAKPQKNMYSQIEPPRLNKSINLPPHLGRHYKMPYVVPASATVLVPSLGFDKPDERKNYLPLTSEQEHIQKLNTFINDIANRDYTAEGKFNCFNRECANRARVYRVNMNNGVLNGTKCVCQKSSSASQRAQQWWGRKNPVNASEKAAIRSFNANESDESFESLIKETKKLSKIVEGME